MRRARQMITPASSGPCLSVRADRPLCRLAGVTSRCAFGTQRGTQRGTQVTRHVKTNPMQFRPAVIERRARSRRILKRQSMQSMLSACPARYLVGGIRPGNHEKPPAGTGCQAVGCHAGFHGNESFRRPGREPRRVPGGYIGSTIRDSSLSDGPRRRMAGNNGRNEAEIAQRGVQGEGSKIPVSQGAGSNVPIRAKAGTLASTDAPSRVNNRIFMPFSKWTNHPKGYANWSMTTREFDEHGILHAQPGNSSVGA